MSEKQKTMKAPLFLKVKTSLVNVRIFSSA